MTRLPHFGVQVGSESGGNRSLTGVEIAVALNVTAIVSSVVLEAKLLWLWRKCWGLKT